VNTLNYTVFFWTVFTSYLLGSSIYHGILNLRYFLSLASYQVASLWKQDN